MIQSNLEFEREKRDFAMALAAEANPTVLRIFRCIAVELYEQTGEPISVVDVRNRAQTCGVHYESGNWLGSLFKGGEWEPVGFTQVTHKGGHARNVRTWRLK